MTAEERRRLKPVRRWIVVVIDVATRAILGYAICKAPNQAASLQALRVCSMDKTLLLRAAGITKAHWSYVCPLIKVTTDSGSDFGKYPFGGSRFASAVQRLSGSLMTKDRPAEPARARGTLELDRGSRFRSSPCGLHGPVTYAQDAQLLRSAAGTVVRRAGLADGGLFDEPEFLNIFMHASAYRFGIAMEMTIEAIDEAMSEGDREIGLDHFAGAYLRMNCDDDLNPFISRHWKAIDTTIAMDRILEQRKEELRKEAEKGKKRKATPARLTPLRPPLLPSVPPFRGGFFLAGPARAADQVSLGGSEVRPRVSEVSPRFVGDAANPLILLRVKCAQFPV